MNAISEFFVFHHTNDKKIEGECKLCGKVYLDNTGSTGNFHKHLKRKHTNQYEKSKFPDSLVCENDTYTEPENLKDNVIKINQIILKELIVRCNLPPAIVEYSGFRNFLKTIAPKWKPASSRYFTKTLLPTLMSTSQDKIRTLLDSIDHLSITVDVWVDRRGRSFIGVTGHFLDLNFAPLALLLDFSRLKGPHTGENIRLVTDEILRNLKIRDKVYRIITDNAASMVKAYKFGLTMNDDDNDNTIKDDNNLQLGDCLVRFTNDDDSNISSEWILADWYVNDKDSIDNGKDVSSIRLSCFAHSLQLTIRDGLKDTPYLSRSLLKCIQLAQRSSKSTKIADLLENIGKTINRSNMTRWNSEYLLIKSIIGLGKKTIDEITDIIDDNELKFSNNDFIILQEAVDILEPFAEITSRIQADSVVTASLVVPSVVHMIDHVNTIKPHLSFLKKMCIQLEQSINKRFAGIVKRLSQQCVTMNDPFSDQMYFVCTVLDPEFKFYWLTQMKYKPSVESQMKQLITQMILDECEHTMDSSLSSTFMVNNDKTQSIDISIKKKRKLFHYDDESNLSVDSIANPTYEINAYINDPTRLRFSSYWKNSSLCSLKNVVKRIFSVQASSAPVERVFSQAGLIMSPRRTSMLEEVFRSLVFLRVNQNLLQ
ncbi:unnamed protein product [Rotaria socialis]|uniref:BED-type domain-containing protein n=1 Tax=Rotaria socialis TaxID=392032 RepID=A0A818NVF0_9BILA|nr:unnamed protein product [Rotaria socialis]CAF4855707.1 unnamed protein product [Rotaria socialis]